MDNGLPAGSCGRTCRKISSASRPVRMSPPFSRLPAGEQPHRLFSSSSYARVRYTRSGLIFGRGCVYPPLHPRRRPADRCARHGVTRRNTAPDCRVALFITSAPAPDSAPDPARSSPSAEFAGIHRIPLTVRSLAEMLSSCGSLEAINPYGDRKVNGRPVITIDLRQ